MTSRYAFGAILLATLLASQTARGGAYTFTYSGSDGVNPISAHGSILTDDSLLVSNGVMRATSGSFAFDDASGYYANRSFALIPVDASYPLMPAGFAPDGNLIGPIAGTSWMMGTLLFGNDDLAVSVLSFGPFSMVGTTLGAHTNPGLARTSGGNLEFQAVPEPMTMGFAIAGVGFAAHRLRRAKR